MELVRYRGECDRDQDCQGFRRPGICVIKEKGLGERRVRHSSDEGGEKQQSELVNTLNQAILSINRGGRGGRVQVRRFWLAKPKKENIRRGLESLAQRG